MDHFDILKIKPIKIGGLEYPDPLIHDSQHWVTSIVGMISGISIFVTYYFFSRIESQSKNDPSNKLPWSMPVWYFVVGAILSAFAVSSIACVLSTAIRPREIKIIK